MAADDELPGQDPDFFFSELPPEYIKLVMEEAREIRLGGRSTPQALAMRKQMIDEGEAPPIIPNEPEEDTNDG